MKFMFLQCVVSVTIETPAISYAYQIIKWSVRFKKLSVRITLSVLRKRRPRKIYNLSWHDLNSHTFNMAKFVRDLHCRPVQGTWTIARSFCPLYLCMLTLNDLHNNFDTRQSRYSDLLTDWKHLKFVQFGFESDVTSEPPRYRSCLECSPTTKRK